MIRPKTISELQAAHDWQIPAKRRDAWRVLFPAYGFLRGLSATSHEVYWVNAHNVVCWFTEHSETALRVQILATDGVVALFRKVWTDEVFLGHLANFVGPVGKEEIDERDWDWNRNKRIVKVFRRRDGSCAIIPQDTIASEYFERHAKCDTIEHEVFVMIGNGGLPPDRFDEVVARLREAKAAADATRKGKPTSTRKAKYDKILAAI